MNPYSGQSFFGFFKVFAQRLLTGFAGGLENLFTDEIQLITLLFIAISSAIIGTFFVLKKMTMLANSFSHTILLGIVGAFLILGGDWEVGVWALLIAAMIAVCLTIYATNYAHQVLQLQKDASIGLVFTGFFALGVILITVFTRNSHLGLEAIMGNLDALHYSDMYVGFAIFILNACIVFGFFRYFELVVFEDLFAKNMGISLGIINFLLMFQLGVTAVGAFRSVGVFLFLAFLVVPVIIARLFTYRLKTLLYLSILISSSVSICGVALSRHCLSIYYMPISTAGLVVTMLGLCLLLAMINHKVCGKVFG